MKDYLTVNELSKRLGLSNRRITGLINEGYFKGAYKQGKSWRIPRDFSLSDNELIYNANISPLPIGVSNYKSIVKEYYYVDKTLLIKDIIDEKARVSLFTRPRRFGKTLNMNMLKTFFEISDDTPSAYFKDKKIWKYGKKYKDYCGKYPVIFISFKDVKYNNWNNTVDAIKDVVSKEAQRHIYLRNSDKCNEFEKTKFEKMLSSNLNEIELSSALYDLSVMLDKHFNKPPIIIIDEYDTPIEQGYSCAYYDQIILFMRNLFSSVLKDNEHMSFGFLTGVLKISKESIFSGLNNLKVNSILDNRYSGYFGFTKQEVIDIAEYYGTECNIDEICKWYDGYKFGKSEIFNPWSIINYFGSGNLFKPYWQATGSNEIIKDILKEADRETYDNLSSLLNGNSLTTYIDTDVIYPQIKNNPSTIYSFLTVAGYLKINKQNIANNGDLICEVSLPNKEIALIYHKEILEQLNNIFSANIAISISEALFKKDLVRLKKLLSQLLLNSVSYYDTMHESFYHGFMLGLCALFNGVFISSNKESGNGRYDIELKPIFKGLPGIIIELKHVSNENDLKKASKLALKQISDNKYDTEMVKEGVKTIFKYGVAFSGKNVEISSE